MEPTPTGHLAGRDEAVAFAIPDALPRVASTLLPNGSDRAACYPPSKRGM